MIKTKEYEELMKPISAFMWINENSVPSVIAYGTYDRVCPFNTVRHLIKALQDNNVDYKYFEVNIQDMVCKMMIKYLSNI